MSIATSTNSPTPRADVVGSLLRPQYLLAAREQLERGELTPAAFKAIEDRAVDEAVALQEAAGLDVITDGEMRRYAFYGHLVEALEGFDKYAGWSITFRDGEGHEANLKRPVVVEKLKWRRQMAVEEFTYLRGRTRAQVKVTLLSAQQAAAYYDPERSKGAYATRDAYLADLVDFTRREIDELRRLGCEYVQIDAPQYAALLDEKMREGYRQRGSDPDKMLDANIELDNAIVAGHPGMTFGIHICRGNHKSMFYASGGYDRIAAHVFKRTQFDRYLLEYDDERSGTFEPLKHVPDDRVVVLGLISSKVPQLESEALLRERIAEASKIVPLERLALSPQCGFASTHEGNRLSEDDQRKKLQLVGRVAKGSGLRSIPNLQFAKLPREALEALPGEVLAIGLRVVFRLAIGTPLGLGSWKLGIDSRSYHRRLMHDTREVAGTQPPAAVSRVSVDRAAGAVEAADSTAAQLHRPRRAAVRYLAIGETDNDLTRQHAGEPLGERIVVAGRVLDEDGRAVPDTLVELWQCNAAGRYLHARDDHPAPLDPNFSGAGRTMTDAEGRYRFTTIKPGAYPWRNHPNAWRPAHIHFSLFGTSFLSRLVTQMYFPNDPLFPHDPIFNSIPDEPARQRLISRFDLDLTEPEWALGYRFDIVLRGRESTPFEQRA